ncbi:BON domain-containing protein [Novipirellula galeiformis]|uniref:BON domain-containing protein n=1 Tax=Novipirellula galeiformis TaxID=2528004 RepID=UPI0011B4B6D0
MSDSLESRLQASLQRLGFSNIQVSSESNGHIQLSGTVEDPNERASALSIARTTPGVAKISNRISISS